MSLANKIREIRKSKGLTQEEFCAKIGVSRASVAQYETSKAVPPPDTLLKIAEFGGVDVNTLINNVNTNSAAEPTVPYYTDRESKLIPFYNIDVTAGSKDLFIDNRETIDYKIDMPGFKDCDFAVPVSGHSMYPKISSGNIIFCKKVNHREFIEYGHIYLIVTNDRRMIKQIRRSNDKESLMLVSENPEYDTFDLKKELIQHLYLVKGWANKNEI